MQNYPFLNNNLFTTYTLEVDFPKIYDFTKNQAQAQNALKSIQSLYNKALFEKQNEHQFEDTFITKVLEILGWEFVRQDEKIIQGKLEKPDFLLFSNLDSKKAYQNIPKDERQASNAQISVILESKAYNVEVDNKKIKENPHFQLLRYLSNLKKDFGFLTNGRVWRFYDNSKLSAQKVFYEINLESIIESNDAEGFNYFYYIFQANNFAQKTSDTQSQTTITDILNKNNQAKINIEDDLQSLIYGINGKDSLFEEIGSCIYAKNQNAKLKDIYQSSLYFIFRLLFIAYFEDKFDSVLQSHSSFKKKISLYSLLSRLKQEEKESEENESFVGIDELERIFRIYNKGNPNLDMPIFNGGLFDEANAPLLKTPKIFNDKTLIHILDSLFNYQGTDTQNTLFRRDYRTLSVAHLGTIYEGLLSYFFAVAEEEVFYLVYAPKKGKGKLDSIEGYFDSYDYAKIKKDSTIHREATYKKGQIYLKNTSNSRKSTASFYTPESITKFLVQSALKDRLDDSNILHFKILDNACGSGHFLVEALNQITQIVQSDFDSFPALKKIYEQEKQTIQNNICAFIKGYEADESDILKRLLLKRVIFGVDLNPFSIELTKLSLWIDSFIFGTPLSFLEHHIKCGNALIGTSIREFTQYFNALQKAKGGNLFISRFLDEFQILSEVFVKLDSIKDTTEAQIKESKRLYKEEIAPTLEKLNLFLNMLNARDFMNAKEAKAFNALTQSDNIENLSEAKEYENLREVIHAYAKEFGFFNYEIEFPEITGSFSCHSEPTGEESRNADSKSFANAQHDKAESQHNKQRSTTHDICLIGFQAIVGNPPWDKTKFSDSDFFPQFISNYRTLSNSEKKEVQENLLAKSYITKEYEETKAFVSVQNDYYKAHFPLNRGSGDGNLFRFFVERNLNLLAPNASLNYVLPSALMLEKGSKILRKEILENKSLVYFYSFENRKGIFRDVDFRYKFALMQIINAKPYHSEHSSCRPELSSCHSEPTGAESHNADSKSFANAQHDKAVSNRDISHFPNAQYDKPHAIQTMFYKTNIEEIYDKSNIIPLTLQDIKTLSPHQLALQEVRGKKDLEILRKCYAAFSPLNLEWLDFRNELHMTQDKDLFIESYRNGLLPLYEGKMIHQFDAEFTNPQYFLNIADFDRRLRSKEIYRLKQDLGIDSKEYGKLLESMLASYSDIPPCHSEGSKATEESHKDSKRGISALSKPQYDKKALEDSFIKYDREFYRLGFRAIARDTDERTLIFSLYQKNIGFGHTMYGSIPKTYALEDCIPPCHSEPTGEESRKRDVLASPQRPKIPRITYKTISHLRLCFALGIFNSLVVDFIARGMIQISVDKTYILRIPLPQPSDKEILENATYLSIAKNALILQLYNDKAGHFKELQEEFNIAQNEIPKTDKAYAQLRAKQDIAIAKLYGLDKEEFCYLLESFKVLQTKQPEFIALLKSLWE
ncbi:Eco57I restriction-modification methylase domain-containing protein [Helicobacter himalayensis]|uniref:Eco57I restriction-modification methylase domain-containing protein n=1 Tax=Helicobacter himalayensis TaxID=1591088 RepID=UPI000833E6B5|nr:N-6 DNA methylase [Helicobacter himalayensis]